MDGHAFYKYSSPVIAMGITIYPKTCNYGRYKIIINRNGKEQIGEEYYEDKPSVKLMDQKTTTGIIKIKVPVPSVYEKILELYKEICIKNKLLNN